MFSSSWDLAPRRPKAKPKVHPLKEVQRRRSVRVLWCQRVKREFPIFLRVVYGNWHFSNFNLSVHTLNLLWFPFSNLSFVFLLLLRKQNSKIGGLEKQGHGKLLSDNSNATEIVCLAGLSTVLSTSYDHARNNYNGEYSKDITFWVYSCCNDETVTLNILYQSFKT